MKIRHEITRRNGLIKDYKKMGKSDLKVLEDWENASEELD